MMTRARSAISLNGSRVEARSIYKGQVTTQELENDASAGDDILARVLRDPRRWLLTETPAIRLTSVMRLLTYV